MSVFDWQSKPCAISAEFITRGKVQANSSAMVERRREEGRDVSTIVGLSKKADAIRRPHGGAYTRAINGRPTSPDGKAGRLRKLLEAGPMTRREMSDATGYPLKSISGLLRNDVDKGNIRESQNSMGKIQFTLVVHP